MTPRDFSEIWYLAVTIYGEARGEELVAKEAVAWVIRNRVEDPRWPNSYAEVTTQQYQFSCWNEWDPNRARMAKPGRLNKRDYEAWLACIAVASDVYFADPEDNPLPGVTFYHDTSIEPPHWTRQMTPVPYPDCRKFRFYKA